MFSFRESCRTEYFRYSYLAEGARKFWAPSALFSNIIVMKWATTTFGAIALDNNEWRSGRLFTDKNAAGYIFKWSIGSYNAAARFELRVNRIAVNYLALIARSMIIDKEEGFQAAFFFIDYGLEKRAEFGIN